MSFETRRICKSAVTSQNRIRELLQGQEAPVPARPRPRSRVARPRRFERLRERRAGGISAWVCVFDDRGRGPSRERVHRHRQLGRRRTTVFAG